MDNLMYILFVSMAAPILLMVLLVDKKLRLPMTFVLFGIVISVFSAEVNTLLAGLLNLDGYRTVVVLTPATEEILKAIPVLVYAVAISDNRERLFTASMAVGVGFALLENTFFLLQTPETFTVVDAMIRAFGAGLMHGMCTLVVGVGISFVRRRKKLFAAGTFSLLTLAIVYHAIYNMLMNSNLVAVGALIPFLTYVPFFVWRMKRKIRQAKEKKELKVK